MVRFSVWEIINFVLILIALNSLKVQSRDGVFFFFFWLIVSMRLRVMLRVSTINSHWEFLEQKNENFRDMSGRRSSFLPRYDARARTPHNTTQNRSRAPISQWSYFGNDPMADPFLFFASRFSIYSLGVCFYYTYCQLSPCCCLFMNFGWVCAVCSVRSTHFIYVSAKNV